jgi:prepilin-type N-terminal cleavage/methylation domain-containing protein
MRTPRGFTLIELMIVVVIIGILAAIAIPNFVAMQDRAKEGSVKTNMHTFQLAAEDYGIQNNGLYAGNASEVASVLPAGGARYNNPFDQTTGSGNAWVDVAAPVTACPGPRGVVSYGDTAQLNYAIRGEGKFGDLTLILSSGQ